MKMKRISGEEAGREFTNLFPRIIVRHEMRQPWSEVQISLPGTEQGLSSLWRLLWRIGSDDFDWLMKHREELQEKYPDRYVIIFGRKVLATAKSDWPSRERAFQRLERQGMPRGVTTDWFFDRKGAERPRRVYYVQAVKAA